MIWSFRRGASVDVRKEMLRETPESLVGDTISSGKLCLEWHLYERDNLEMMTRARMRGISTSAPRTWSSREDVTAVSFVKVTEGPGAENVHGSCT